MTRKELRTAVRTRLDDLVGEDSTRFWKDAELNDYLEEAVEELVTECMLITDSLTASVCTVTLVAAQYHYLLSRKIIRIDDIRTSWGTSGLENAKTYRRFNSTWQTDTGQPTAYTLDFSTGYLTLNKAFTAVTTEALALTVKRLPLTSMADTDEPEFDDQYHRKLIPFVLWKSYSKQDAEIQNNNLAGKFYSEWEDAVSSVKSREARLRPRVMIANSVEI